MTKIRSALAAALAAATAAATLVAGAPQASATTCIGASTEDRLFAGQALCSGGYRLEMQTNGDLVLWTNSGRACWLSGTAGIPDVYADYDDSLWGPPTLKLVAPGGPVRTYQGGYTWTIKDGNLSLNSKGEVWIAYKRFAWC